MVERGNWKGIVCVCQKFQIQYDTECYSTVHGTGYRMVQYDTVWYSMIQYDTEWYRMIRIDTEGYSLIQNGTEWYSSIQNE